MAGLHYIISGLNMLEDYPNIKEYIKKSFNEVRLAVARLNSFVQEHLTGMSIVQIFNAEKSKRTKARTKTISSF